ncbi:Predicted arabinose efflux permease, MFS family [Rathayibacter oskolensis]|uniref:Predicted arabinose efflux permease, MFS family n=1 Tax=Rathayibacter oskolensis TaxID=1891671 RepID=A0A1X7NYR7_9MICO|nr:MFS transporter [Rathayibacter oskolensis]SMH43104.1 Predicted arabinose efflux permease, MFS family [Rathayibacter oskolensis]
MTPGLTLLFAVAGGAAVGNLYWAQPLLGVIGDSFGVTTSAAGLLVTVTQVGYALGVFLLVPLGDTVDRRRMIPTLMVLAAVFLAGTALAPAFPVLLATLALIGVTTVAGQLLTPLAGDLASDEQRGRVLGTVASGLMLGLLISRAISGIVADLLGWRAVFAIAAVLMLVLAVVMARRLPTLPPRERVPYAALLGSVLRTVAGSRAVRVTVLLGGSAMCAFTLFWTGLTFLLSSAPYSYSATAIGLVSLVGIAGAVSAQRVGRLFDRGLSLPALGAGLAVALAGLVIAGIGAASIVVVLVAVGVFSIGLQAVQVLAQTRMLSIDPAARSRLNTVYIVGNFAGGALGSALAGVLWQSGGWAALLVVAAGVLGFAITVWAVQRTRALAG